MLALIVDGNRQNREVVAHHLQSAQYRVAQAADPAAALDAYDRERPDVIVVAWGPMVPQMLTQVRSREVGDRSYVLAVLEGQPASDIPRLYAAGADDFCRRPFSREELLGRLEAPKRIRLWARAVPAQEWTDLSDFQKLRVWRELGSLIAHDIAQLVGPLRVERVGTVSNRALGATIPLSLAQAETEIRVSVLIEVPYLATFSELLLGAANAPEEAMHDMLRELANTAAGAVKRAALFEQVTVTTGLPVNATVWPTEATAGATLWTASLHGYDARLAFVGEVIARANQSVAANDLREGMVLAHDLRSPSGALVLPAGTRLTVSAIERVVGLFGKRFKVDVACAA